MVAVTRPREVYPITGLSETGVALGWGTLVEMKTHIFEIAIQNLVVGVTEVRETHIWGKWG